MVTKWLGGGENREVLVKGYKVSVLQVEYVLEIYILQVPVVKNTVLFSVFSSVQFLI